MKITWLFKNHRLLRQVMRLSQMHEYQYCISQYSGDIFQACWTDPRSLTCNFVRILCAKHIQVADF